VLESVTFSLFEDVISGFITKIFDVSTINSLLRVIEIKVIMSLFTGE